MEQQDDDQGGAGLGAMRLMMSGTPLAGQKQIEDLASQPVIDPSNKWLNFASGALADTKSGHFSESLSNAIGGYSGSQTKEAELRAKYLPIVAQALLQRQQMQFTQANTLYKLQTEWDNDATGALTGLLSQPGGISKQAVGQTLMQRAQLGAIPKEFAQRFYSQVPDDPMEARSWLQTKAMSRMDPAARMKSVTPEVDLTNTGGNVTPINKNPYAPGGVGPVAGAPAVPNTLKPNETLPTIKDTPRGPVAVNPVTMAAAPVGSPEAAQLAGAPGAPAPGAPPLAPQQPGQPPLARPAGPGPGTGPVVTDLARDQGDKDLGTEFGKYQSALGDKITALTDTAQRTKQMLDYMKDFRSGATAHARLKTATTVKDMALTLGVPQQQADTIANKLMQGDIGSATAFQKLQVQGSMEALKAAAGAGQRFTQFEYAQFAKNNLNIENDPNAMEKIANFVNEQLRKTQAEYLWTSQQYADKKMPVEQIRPMWAARQLQTGNSQPREVSGTIQGTTAGQRPTVNPIGTSLSGKKIIMGPNGPEYQ